MKIHLFPSFYQFITESVRLDHDTVKDLQAKKKALIIDDDHYIIFYRPDDSQRSKFTEAHNKERELVKSSSVEYSDELENDSLQWAIELCKKKIKDPQKFQYKENSEYGQLIAAGIDNHGNSFSFMDAFSVWHNERYQFFRYSVGRNNDHTKMNYKDALEWQKTNGRSISNYTQLIWNDTTEIGVAGAQLRSFSGSENYPTFIVGTYDAAGNTISALTFPVSKNYTADKNKNPELYKLVYDIEVQQDGTEKSRAEETGSVRSRMNAKSDKDQGKLVAEPVNAARKMANTTNKGSSQTFGNHQMVANARNPGEIPGYEMPKGENDIKMHTKTTSEEDYMKMVVQNEILDLKIMKDDIQYSSIEKAYSDERESFIYHKQKLPDDNGQKRMLIIKMSKNIDNPLEFWLEERKELGIGFNDQANDEVVEKTGDLKHLSLKGDFMKRVFDCVLNDKDREKSNINKDLPTGELYAKNISLRRFFKMMMEEKKHYIEDAMTVYTKKTAQRLEDQADMSKSKNQLENEESANELDKRQDEHDIYKVKMEDLKNINSHIHFDSIMWSGVRKIHTVEAYIVDDDPNSRKYKKRISDHHVFVFLYDKNYKDPKIGYRKEAILTSEKNRRSKLVAFNENDYYYAQKYDSSSPYQPVEPDETKKEKPGKHGYFNRLLAYDVMGGLYRTVDSIDEDTLNLLQERKLAKELPKRDGKDKDAYIILNVSLDAEQSKVRENKFKEIFRRLLVPRGISEANNIRVKYALQSQQEVLDRVDDENTLYDWYVDIANGERDQSKYYPKNSGGNWDGHIIIGPHAFSFASTLEHWFDEIRIVDTYFEHQRDANGLGKDSIYRLIAYRMGIQVSDNGNSKFEDAMHDIEMWAWKNRRRYEGMYPIKKSEPIKDKDQADGYNGKYTTTKNLWSRKLISTAFMAFSAIPVDKNNLKVINTRGPYGGLWIKS